MDGVEIKPGAFVASLIIFLCIIAASTSIASGTKIDTDEKGVPFVDYGYVSPKGDTSNIKNEGWIFIGKQRNPLTISSTGLEYYEQYILGNNSTKELFLNCADWLVDNAVRKDGYLVWEYTYNWPTYNNTAPFISGMAQATAIQTLATAYKVTGEKKYLEAAKLGLGAFFIEVRRGGVTYKDNEGWWYEEYAQPGMEIQPRVLNGHIVSLIRLYEYYNLTKDEQAKYLFEAGVNDLRARLVDYDTGN